jgi:hypothetical protein
MSPSSANVLSFIIVFGPFLLLHFLGVF